MSKPNVVFVFGDQWRGQAVGYNGDPNVRTPNIDSLREQSLNLTDATSGCPVCSPYRASFISGLHPLNNGVFVNDVALADNPVSIGSEFKREGYNTAYIGKWHVDGRGRSAYIPPERRQGFDYWKAQECTHNYQESYYYEGGSSKRQLWDGYDAYAQTQDAIRYIENYDDSRPFLLVLSWGPPHAPYDLAPLETRQLYDPDKIRLRDNVPDSMSHPARELLAGYYAHCTALDRCVGELVAALSRNRIENNTILMFTSDHGDMLGSQGMWKKQQPFDESIRVPFLVRYPDQLGWSGRDVEGVFVDAVDLMPTLLALSGGDVPSGIDGINLAPILRGDAPVPEDSAALLACYHAFGQWRKGKDGGQFGYSGREYRGLRTRRYTYVRDLDGPWLLFDNRGDPFQQHNLVNDSGLRDTVSDMEQRLQRELARRGDKFLPGMEYIHQWNYAVDSEGTVPWSW